MALALVTQPAFAETVALLRQAGLEVDANPGPEPWPADELRRRAADADGMLAFMADRVDARFLAGCPRLRVVACAAKGVDNFDAEACARAGVWLTAVPDLLTDATAELAVGLAIALCRNVLAGDALVRACGFAGWRPILYGAGLAGAAVGIAGMGKLGRAIARRVAGFRPARVLCHDERPLEKALELGNGFHTVGWEALLAESDLLFLALPLTARTRHLVDAAALARCRPGCRIVNAGRGGVVDEAAVAAALAAGTLAGYAADVFELEDWAVPDRPSAIPPGLLARRDRTVLTPHLGSAIVEVRRAVEHCAARNLVAALAGEVPPDAVNRPGPRP